MHPWFKMDPFIVLSLTNMKLRNFYDSLDHLCEDVNFPRQALEDKLRGIGYRYDRQGNHFISDEHQE